MCHFNRRFLFSLLFPGNPGVSYLRTYLRLWSWALSFRHVRNTSYPNVGVLSLHAFICLFHPRSPCLPQTFCQYFHLKCLAEFSSLFTIICVLVHLWCFLGLFFFFLSLHLLLFSSCLWALALLRECSNWVISQSEAIVRDCCLRSGSLLSVAIFGLLSLLIVFMPVLFSSLGSKIR